MSQPNASTDNHHAAGYYEIRLQGHLATRWAAWFDGMCLGPPRPGRGGPTWKTGCRPLILIVDDDDSACSILVETLKGEGYSLERLVRACQQRTSDG